MIDNPDFYTKTMAKVYADQGYLSKAAEIYRFLLKQEPDRQDIIDELSEIDRKLSEKAQSDPVLLLSKWIDLELKYNNLKKLKNIRNAL
ncbi:MAG: hypothetical protein HQ573_06080 [Desulfobacteraceae bacterium]|nr:hypothetical protein [Desulfobacteraceae bacterium]